MNPGLKIKTLGNTGLKVTDFCLGVLPMGPLQANLPEKECIQIIEKAIEMGVNFIDTAEAYQTQSYIGKAIGEKRNDLVISTKSFATSYDECASSVEKSLTELQTDHIDIYHLHAAKATINVFTERKGALDYLNQAKKDRVIKSIGIATHSVKVVDEAAKRDDIDIIFALINKVGLGILEGSTEDMINSIQKANNAGKGVYVMKPLGGGNLLAEIDESIGWVRSLEGVSSTAVGVVSIAELLYNLKLFEANHPEIKDVKKPNGLSKIKKLLILKQFCDGCGNCVNMCPNEALTLVDNKASVDRRRCLLCNYCASVCPNFAFRTI